MLTMAESLLRILVIAAHPDDIEFGVAGSVARWRDEGAHVAYCIVTDGAAGSNDPAADPAELARTRQAEQRAAADIVGVREIYFLDYPDGTLQPTLELRRDLTRLIRQFRPDRVVIMDPTVVLVENFYINHPDHRAAGEAALYAVFPSAGTRLIFPELLAEGLEPHEVSELYLFMSPQPDLAVDITPYLERKIEALLCHRSQVRPEMTDMVRQWAADAGQKHGLAYAETFRVMQLKQPETAVGDAATLS